MVKFNRCCFLAFILVASEIISSSNIQAGLVADFTLNDPVGSTSIADSSGNGLGLSASNITLGTNGIAGTAGLFQSSASRASAMDSPELRPSSFSLVAWVNPLVLGQKTSIVGKETSGGASWGLETLADNQYNFFVFTSTSNVDGNQSTTLASVGSWVQLIGVYDAVNGTTKLYVNGVAQGIQQGSFAGNPVYDSGAFDIGERLGGFSLRSFDGSIDDVQLYNQVLSTDDVAYLYSNPGTVAPPLLGDANDDGKVDLTDLNIVLNNLGATNSNRSAGNFDNAPTIDLTDLNDVLNNLGEGSMGASVASPEPTSLGFFATGMFWLLASRSRGMLYNSRR